MKPVAEVSLKNVLIASMIAVIILTTGLVGYVAFDGGRHAVADVSKVLRDEISSRIEEHVKSFLSVPHLINRANAGSLRKGLLAPDDPSGLASRFREQIGIFGAVSSISFGNSSGGLVNSGRETSSDARYVILTDGFVAGTFRKYEVDEEGRLGRLLARIPNFDARTRSWYIDAVLKGTSVWSDIYVLFTGQDMALPASLPVHSRQGELLGVVTVDVFLSHIARFLSRLHFSPTGLAFVMERSGFLVASSVREMPFTVVAETGMQRRVNVLDSAVPEVRRAAESIAKRFGTFGNVRSAEDLSFTLDGRRYTLRVCPLRDLPGIDWLVVVVLPETAVMSGVMREHRVTIALIAGILAIVIFSGVFLSGRAAQSVLRLNDAVAALARGERSEVADAGGRIREFNTLFRSCSDLANRIRKTADDLDSEALRRVRAEKALSESERESRERSASDPVTGLPNRRAFLARLEGEWIRLRRHGGIPVPLLLIASDSLRRVNNRFGFAKGDSVLTTIARVIRECIGAEGVAGRIGDAEFAVLLPGVEEETAVLLAEHIRERSEEQRAISGLGREFFVLRVAVTSICADDPDVDAPLMRAGVALGRDGRD